MTDIVKIERSITRALAAQPTAEKVALELVPQLRQAIELCKKPEDANTLRSLIGMAQAFLKQNLPKELRNRSKQFNRAFPANWGYLEASAKAGILWGATDNKANRGSRKEYQSNIGEIPDVVYATDAGFRGSRDATACKRTAELLLPEIHPEMEIYKKDCQEDERVPTLGGVERIWRALYSKPPEPIKGKYRVIYADPPWDYGNTMPDYAPMPEDHYNPISDELLMQMNVEEVADDNAVLFIWTTSPKLEDSFGIIEAWGFRYKASFIWDKQDHNMGHYNSVRHEFLLICTRGSCQPDSLTLFDSVQSIKRTKHSVKPEKFREIIDTLYPIGNRIELFARKKVKGWECYGDEEIP